MKATITSKVALEIVDHATRAMVLVHVELKTRKTTNAQPKFSKSSSKLLHTFVAPKNQTEERILETT
jgi:hypothetical protein